MSAGTIDNRLNFDKNASALVAAYKDAFGLDAALALSPIVRVPKSTQYPYYAAGAFQFLLDSTRAIGADTKRVTIPGASWAALFCAEHSLMDATDYQTEGREGVVQGLPDTDTLAKARTLKNFIDQELIYNIGVIAQTLTNKATPTTKWNASGGDPDTDLKTAWDTFCKNLGMPPNILAVTARALPFMAKGMRTAYGITAGISNLGIVKEFLMEDLQIPVEKLVILPSYYHDGTNYANSLFGGEGVFLIRNTDNPSLFEPSCMKTFMPNDVPDVRVLPPWEKEDKSGRWVKVIREYVPKLVMDNAGYWLYTVLE